MIARRVHNLVMDDVAAALRADPALAGINVVTQNEEDLATLITEEESRLDGVVVVVTVDAVRKIHSRPDKYAVDFTASVTEIVPINRESPDYVTAIDVAAECGEAIDAAGIGHFTTLRHSTPGNGILNAVAECSGEFTIEEQE